MHGTNMMLVEQIVSTGGRLSILHAPAGFGKTRIMKHVAENLKERGTPIFESPNESIPSDQPGWLLLDEPDGSSVDADKLRQVLDMSSAATGVGVVVACRNFDKLPLARLRAEGRVARFGPRQLAVSQRDAASAFATVLDKKRADWLGALVGGWPAAVGFLVDYARESEARLNEDGDFIAGCGLSAYIDQEVLKELPTEWIEALRFASIFSRCDRTMLDAVRPEGDLGRHLAQLRQRLPGLVDDREGQTWINPLLRLHLLRQFEDLPRHVRADALDLASQLCVRNGRAAEGASLVTRVGDPEAIIAFVRRSQGLRLWVTAGFDVIREIVTQAGARGVEDEPRLKLLRCAVHMKDGEIGEGERLFSEVLPLLARDEAAMRDADVVRTTLLIYGCREVTDDDVARLRHHIVRNSDDPSWKALILSLQCILSIQRGDLDDAASLIVEAEKQARAASTAYGQLFLEIHSINIALARGDLKGGRALLGQARKLWRQHFSSDVGIQTILDALTASLEFEGGRLSSARVHIKRSTHQMPHVEAWLDIYAAAYEPMARLLAVDIGLAATLSSLKAQQDALNVSGLPRVARLVTALGICLRGEAHLRGNAQAGVGISLQKLSSPMPSWQERELFNMAEAYVYLCGDQPGKARTVLCELLAFTEPRGLLRTSLRARLLLVTALDQLGDAKDADVAFAEALQLGEITGMVRVFAEVGGDAVRKRVTQSLAKVRSDGWDARRAKLFRTLSRWEDVSPETGTVMFTPRELDVLAALEQGGADKTIGRQLGITEHAVRYHLKNIYRKLDVHDRTGALARAKDLEATS